MPLRSTLRPAALLCLSAATLSAQTKEVKDPIDIWTDTAVEKAAKSNGMIAGDHAISQVLVEASKKRDAELNKVYKRLMARLPQEDAERLKLAQKAWLQWRNLETDFNDKLLLTPESGTMALIVAAQGNLSLVRQRVLDLRDYEHMLDNPP